MKSKVENTGSPIDEQQDVGVTCIARHLHLVTLPLPQSEYRRTSQNASTGSFFLLLLRRLNLKIPYLTFKNRASYIYKTGVTLPSRCCILYIFSTNISTEYFKQAAHSPFISSKFRLFHNATFFGSCIIHILHTGVLKLKCKTPVAKG